MAATINFANAPQIGAVSISTANTNRDGTGTIGTVLTAGASGTRIDRVRVQAIVTTTAGMVRLFLYDGSNYFALQEVPVTAVTASGSAAAFNSEITFGDTRPLALPSGWSLRASTNNAEEFHVTAYGADY
jgi:hypothetical protein